MLYLRAVVLTTWIHKIIIYTSVTENVSRHEWVYSGWRGRTLMAHVEPEWNQRNRIDERWRCWPCLERSEYDSQVSQFVSPSPFFFSFFHRDKHFPAIRIVFFFFIFNCYRIFGSFIQLRPELTVENHYNFILELAAIRLRKNLIPIYFRIFSHFNLFLLIYLFKVNLNLFIIYYWWIFVFPWTWLFPSTRKKKKMKSM